MKLVQVRISEYSRKICFKEQTGRLYNVLRTSQRTCSYNKKQEEFHLWAPVITNLWCEIE